MPANPFTSMNPQALIWFLTFLYDIGGALSLSKTKIIDPFSPGWKPSHRDPFFFPPASAPKKTLISFFRLSLFSRCRGQMQNGPFFYLRCNFFPFFIVSGDRAFFSSILGVVRTVTPPFPFPLFQHFPSRPVRTQSFLDVRSSVSFFLAERDVEML